MLLTHIFTYTLRKYSKVRANFENQYICKSVYFDESFQSETTTKNMMNYYKLLLKQLEN